jgi:hypothetical protein
LRVAWQKIFTGASNAGRKKFSRKIPTQKIFTWLGFAKIFPVRSIGPKKISGKIPAGNNFLTRSAGEKIPGIVVQPSRTAKGNAAAIVSIGR